MSLIIRAALSLKPGCRLRYDPPAGGDDYRSQEFFDRYRDKEAEFLGYAEQLVGILDHSGREPGRYIDPKGIRARFNGEEKAYESLNVLHFVVLDANRAVLAEEGGETGRLGDLPHPILFYPDDLVRFTANRPEHFADMPHKVGSVFLEKPFTMSGIPRYEVLENESEYRKRQTRLEEKNAALSEENKLWLNKLVGDSVNAECADLALVSRGNIYQLYHEPAEMSFESDDGELAFWNRSGISYHAPSTNPNEALFDADLFELQEWDRDGGMAPKRLHDRFKQHRERVRALAERVYARKKTQAA